MAYKQQELIDYVVGKVEDNLDKIADGTVEETTFSAAMPYGSIDKSKLLIADWLVTNFPNCVTCISNKKRAFTNLNKNNLIPANIYFINLDKYVF